MGSPYKPRPDEGACCRCLALHQATSFISLITGGRMGQRTIQSIDRTLPLVAQHPGPEQDAKETVKWGAPSGSETPLPPRSNSSAPPWNWPFAPNPESASPTLPPDDGTGTRDILSHFSLQSTSWRLTLPIPLSGCASSM
jgi:hypothetical protein